MDGDGRGNWRRSLCCRRRRVRQLEQFLAVRVVTLERLLQLLLFVGPIGSPRAQQGRRSGLGRGVGGADPCCGMAVRRPAICRHRRRGWTSERWHVGIVVHCCVESSCQGWIGSEARVSHSGSGTGKRVWNEGIREECDVSNPLGWLCRGTTVIPKYADSRGVRIWQGL